MDSANDTTQYTDRFNMVLEGQRRTKIGLG